MSMRVPRSCKVYTPDALASAIIAAMTDEPKDLWLEPCSGKGAFVQALAKIGVPASRIVAVDLETKPCNADNLATSHRGTEFLGWSLSCDQRYSKIVANPPYVSFRRLPSRLQSVADGLDCQWAGASSGNSNLWFAFLRACLSLLKRGGSIGFIVPAAFDYADYAAVLRTTIHKHFSEFEVHRCQKPLFEEVQDGCVVLVGHGYEMHNRSHVRYEYASASDLLHALGRSTRTNPIPIIPEEVDNGQPSIRLGRVMKINIGCVTGDARYFLLRESERIRLNLPVGALSPVLTRARHLRAASVTETYWRKLKAANERIWLFKPESRHVKVPSVRRYLQLEVKKGGCNRKNFKVKSRHTWYRAYVPADVDGFISGTSQFGPWVSLNQYSKLSATNTLYCVKFTKGMSRNERAAWALSLLTKPFRQQYVTKVRSYPDGLTKIEPGDLAVLRIIRPPEDCKGAWKKYQEAVSLLISDGRARAEKLVHEWFRSKQVSHRQSPVRT